jgi:hypothetical protein
VCGSVFGDDRFKVWILEGSSRSSGPPLSQVPSCEKAPSCMLLREEEEGFSWSMMSKEVVVMGSSSVRRHLLCDPVSVPCYYNSSP